VIFVNASALNTNLILLNSISARFPDGLGNDSGMLGKYIGFHNFRGRVMAEYEGFENSKPGGYSAGSAFMPRFQNVQSQQTDFLRGYNTMIFSRLIQDDYKDYWGTELKEMLLNPKLGRWLISAHMMGETIPKETNRVYLDKEKKDKYGLPQLRISVEYDDNDEKMLNHFFTSFTEMFAKAGYTNIRQQDTKRNPGNANHEMGGARMGKDPETSILNQWNQIHGCKNVFVTDGACMTSTSSQNPSLTYMALTARAANYAFEALKKGEI
jgi:choline dehydrogenase-like flavoprotein